MLKTLIPASAWLRSYPRTFFSGDLNAGFTVGVMLIPQGLAYALIAGLPPIYGLYAALLPLFVYALFGSSGQLAVGPVAMVSLLVATGVGELAASGSDEYIQLALLLAFMVGVIQLVLGLLRFGFITNFLSHPVLSGFTSAAALIIGLNQLKHLIGVPIPRTNSVWEILMYAVQNASDIHLITLAIGGGGILLILAVRRFTPRVPGGLLAVILATAAVALGNLDSLGVAIVGSVPAGLPAPSASFLNWSSMSDLLPIALAISLVGYMESIAVAKSFASKNRTSVDPSQELVALGLANLAGSFLQSYPTTGGFSRSAVNDQAGAKTPLASMISASVVGLTLLFFTPLFTFLPKALLASIVMVAVVGLIDIREIRYLWKANRTDFGLLLLTFGATLAFGIEEGILIGVVVSILAFVHQASRPHMAQLGRIGDTTVYRNLERYPDAKITDGVVVFRIDASLFFGNVEFMKEGLQALLNERSDIQVLILDLYPVNRIDSTALHALSDLHQVLLDREVHLLFSGVKGPVRDSMQKAGLMDSVGSGSFFPSIQKAGDKASSLVNCSVANPYLAEDAKTGRSE